MKIKLRLETDESRERWELIKKASEQVDNWDEVKRAEAYRRRTNSTESAAGGNSEGIRCVEKQV